MEETLLAGERGRSKDREVMGGQGLWVQVRTLSSCLSEMGVPGSF